MLAYVFWHWRRSDVPSIQYERALLSFYHVMKAHPPAGFVDCYGFRIESFPWNAPVSKGYEDWYIVKDFRSLGILNEAAVSHQAEDSHNAIASLAAGGAGGIYKLFGKRDFDSVRFSTWFAKPPGISYQQFKSNLTSIVSSGNYWQRQMTLGPGFEFCAHSMTQLSFPSEFRPVNVAVERLGDPTR